MGISSGKIKELFENKLSLRLLAGSCGLDRTVERLAVMETEDFCLGAEPKGMFVLTTLSFVQKDGGGIEAVVALMSEGLSALGIKINRYVNQVPQAILDAAEIYGVPVFEVDGGILFSNMIRLVTEAIVVDEGGKSGLATGHTKLLRKYMNDEPLEAILNSLGEAIGCSCFFVDVRGCILATYTFPAHPENRNYAAIGGKMLEKSLMFTKKEYCFYEGKDAAFLCRAGETLLGVLAVLNMKALSKECEDIVLQTISYVAVRICEQRIVENRSLTDQGGCLLDQVLFRDYSEGEEIRSYLKDGGFDLLDRYAFVVISRRESRGIAGTAPIEYCQAQLQRSFEHCLLKWDHDGIKCLITFGQDSPLARNGGLTDRMTAFQNRFFASGKEYFDIGLSLIQDDPCEMTRSYLQARQAIVQGKIYRPGRHLYDYSAFLIQGLLYRARDTQEYRWLNEWVVKPISERDRIYKSGLWETLDVLFRVRSLKTAASELHIHITTLRYRLQKVKDITGFDFLSAYGNYVLHTAYLIWIENKIRCVGD